MTEWQHKPDQGPGADKSFLIYMAIAFLLVILLYPLIFKQPQRSQPSAMPAPQSKPASSAANSSSATNPTSKSSAPPVNRPTAKPKKITPAVTRQAQSEMETVVENDLYRITFSNRGAQVKSWILKKYKDDKGHPLDLVNATASAKMGFPLSLWTYDEGLRNKLAGALYVSSTQSNALKVPGTLIFEYADQDTIVRKSFRFDNTYVIGVETSVTQNGEAVQAYPAWPAALGDQNNPGTYARGSVDWNTGNDIKRQPAAEHHFFSSNTWVVGGGTYNGPFHWAGVSDQYFAALFMPDEPQLSTVVTLNQEMDIPKDPGNPQNNETTKIHVLGLAAGNSAGLTRGRLFAGPKAVDVLDSIKSAGTNGAPAAGPNLEGAIDFGFFGIFAKWLFHWLNWTHDHMVPNWGWAIIILTVILNVVLLPTRISSMKTSLKMQKIQPQIENIKKKYEKYGMRDPRRAEMNQEIFAMQKKEGVNFGIGCLPMFLQLPLIYAFYAVLASTIALRGAGWLWIHDLSSPDPWHILPIATILSMFVLQQMTPQAGMDAAQRRMMNVAMPIMFGFWTWAVSAGLALYWTISNVISLGIQYGINRSHLGREIRELQEKRARKKASK